MSSILVGRTRARSQAIQLIFQAEIQGVDVFDLLERGEYALDDGPLDDYAAELARGVATNRIAIDRLIGSLSHNWNLSRMPLVDRAVMSISIFEVMCEDDVPQSVAISEAVELSKVYGTDDSSAFVNGILGRVSVLTRANPELSLAQLASLAASGELEDAEAAQGAEADPEAGEQADLPAEGEGQPVETCAGQVPAEEETADGASR